MVAEADLAAWAASQSLSCRQAVEAALRAGILPERFERNFPSLTPGDQLRLFQGSILVAGLGGLGGCQAVLLARLGVGRLLLADGDVFNPANLNRQLLATQDTLGFHKALVTARHLQAINDALLTETIPEFLGPENLEAYLPQIQVALDALDTMAARRQLLAAARQAGVPMVHGAVAGTFGHVTTIMPDDRVGLAYLEAHLEDELTEEPPGVLAPTVTLVASLQVMETVRLILGQPPLYRGKLAHFDGHTGRLEILPLG
jgi:molybdopterin/thiamine biosynthesis adenylyltransferase